MKEKKLKNISFLIGLLVVVSIVIVYLLLKQNSTNKEMQDAADNLNIIIEDIFLQFQK